MTDRDSLLSSHLLKLSHLARSPPSRAFRASKQPTPRPWHDYPPPAANHRSPHSPAAANHSARSLRGRRCLNRGAGGWLGDATPPSTSHNTCISRDADVDAGVAKPRRQLQTPRRRGRCWYISSSGAPLLLVGCCVLMARAQLLCIDGPSSLASYWLQRARAINWCTKGKPFALL